MFNKKLVTSMLSVVTAASILAPCNVFAADKSYTDKGSVSIPITSVDVGSYYTVTLPATIAGFTKNAKTGDYETSFPITVKGSLLPRTEELYVIPAYKDINKSTTAATATTTAANEVAKLLPGSSESVTNPLIKRNSYATNTLTGKNVPMTIQSEYVGFYDDGMDGKLHYGKDHAFITMNGNTYNVSLSIPKDKVTAGTYSGSVEMAWGLVESSKNSGTVKPDDASELVALVDTKEEAEKMAADCGVTLKSYSYGVASFTNNSGKTLDELNAIASKTGHKSFSINGTCSADV